MTHGSHWSTVDGRAVHARVAALHGPDGKGEVPSVVLVHELEQAAPRAARATIVPAAHTVHWSCPGAVAAPVLGADTSTAGRRDLD